MAGKIGLDCKMYFLSTGTRATWAASPTNGVYIGAAPANLTEMTRVKNNTVNVEKTDVDMSSRSSSFKLRRGALKDGAIEFEMAWYPGDAAFDKLRTGFFTDTTVAIVALDGDKTTSGSQGLWADFEILNFSREEQLEGQVVAKVKLGAADSAVPPQWVQVT